MGAYTTFMASDEYATKISGSGVLAVIINALDPSDVIIGAVTGVNISEDFEIIPIEEGGNDGVDEIVQGRHTINVTLQAFWTPKWNDTMPTRQTFIGKEYVILEKVAPGRPQEGNVLNAVTGCKISRVGQAHGARGAKTFDIAFGAERRYSGSEWAALSGTL